MKLLHRVSVHVSLRHRGTQTITGEALDAVRTRFLDDMYKVELRQQMQLE
jgi:hypothetical protein